MGQMLYELSQTSIIEYWRILWESPAAVSGIGLFVVAAGVALGYAQFKWKQQCAIKQAEETRRRQIIQARLEGL